MPKAIKKRAVKQTRSQSETEVLDDLKEMIEGRQRKLAYGAIAAVLVVAALVGVYYYMKSGELREASLQFEGYQYFAGDNPSDPLPEEEKLQRAAGKYAEAYRLGGAAYSLFYEALTLEKQMKYDEALSKYKELEQKHSDSAYFAALSRFKQARVLFKTGKFEEALKKYDELLALNVNFLKDAAIYEQSRVLGKLERDEEALEKMAYLKEAYPDSAFLPPAPAEENVEMTSEIVQTDEESPVKTILPDETAKEPNEASSSSGENK